MIDRKKGIVRGNLMGKRVEFSARSVLSGDPKLGLNEVGLPISICKNLTVPRVVNVYNKHMLTKWSIRYVTKRCNGKRFDASLLSNVAEFVEVGDTIERSLENGDIVAVNRQPSLHRGSMTAMRVRMFPCDTIRINYSSLPSFNGDCDGDEFNIHVPQSDEARAELEELMMMSSSIVCSQSSKPLLGLTQDSLLGAHLMSNHPLEEVDFGSILYQAGVEVAYENFIIPVLLKPKRLYVGFQLINCVLRDLEIDLGEYYNHAGVLIRNGEIIEATFTKATLGIADNSLIHRVFLMYGHNKACLFLERVQRVAEHFMDYHGFSVGISDCVVEHTPLNIDGVDRVIREDLEMRGRMPDEDKLCAALNSITQIAAPESCIGNNRILDMINGGSKGSMVNFNQITRMLSQQFSAQGRLLPEMSNETRYLPHLTKFDYSLEARDFIKNSFIKGLTPIEFWSHAKPSRINLIDTSCKTSVTGDQQRRLVKTLERIVVNDAGSGSRIVQNMTNGQVVSFQYGEDGLDGTYMRTFDEL